MGSKSIEFSLIDTMCIECRYPSERTKRNMKKFEAISLINNSINYLNKKIVKVEKLENAVKNNVIAKLEKTELSDYLREISDGYDGSIRELNMKQMFNSNDSEIKKLDTLINNFNEVVEKIEQDLEKLKNLKGRIEKEKEIINNNTEKDLLYDITNLPME